MKTLDDIAREYRTNKPAIYARVKKLEKLNPDAELTQKIDNTLFLTSKGERLLKSNLNERPIKQKASRQAEQQDTAEKKEFKKDFKNILINDELKTFLKLIKDDLQAEREREIEILRQELDVKNKQIERLTGIIETEIEALKKTLTQSHTLIHREQDLNAFEKINKTIDSELVIETPVKVTEQQKDTKKKSIIAKAVTAFKVIRGDYD